jgi:hypothetical protein
MADVIEIKTYEYYVFSSRDQGFGVNTVIVFYGANSSYIGSAWFNKDNTAPLQPATKSVQGWYTLYYSYIDLPVIVDMLRNEKPVYLIYETSVSPGVNARISTLQEPVGEGEQ